MSTSLSAYRVPPLHEFKAAKEQERLGVPVEVPTTEVERVSRKNKRHTVTVPTVRGYVFTGYKHSMSRHLRDLVGVVRMEDLKRLYVGVPQTPDRKFRVDDKVQTNVGCWAQMMGVVSKVTKKGYLVTFWLFNKPCTVFMPERALIHYVDPG